jgi:hypothetical protein
VAVVGNASYHRRKMEKFGADSYGGCGGRVTDVQEWLITHTCVTFETCAANIFTKFFSRY